MTDVIVPDADLLFGSAPFCVTTNRRRMGVCPYCRGAAVGLCPRLDPAGCLYTCAAGHRWFVLLHSARRPHGWDGEQARLTLLHAYETVFAAERVTVHPVIQEAV